MPLLWPLAFIACLPGIRSVGKNAYRAVAATRIRNACASHGGTCKRESTVTASSNSHA
jgi:hypothetical protein